MKHQISDNLFIRADNMLNNAGQELQRAEEDVVVPSVCYNSRETIYNYLEGYLNDKLILNTFNILWKRSAVSSIKWDNTIYKYQDLDFIFRNLYNNNLKGASINKNLINLLSMSGKRTIQKKKSV